MKQIACLITALALLLSCAALAEGIPSSMQVISCPEQGFSTLCRADYTWDFHPDGGLTINLDETDRPGTVNIFMTDWPGAEFDADYYLNNTYLNQLKSVYEDRLIDEGEYLTMNIGGRDMPAHTYHYRLEDGSPWVIICAYDLQESYFVRYEIDCYGAGGEDDYAMQQLEAIAGYFQPDPYFYSGGGPGTGDGLAELSCPELGFTTRVDPAYPWSYDGKTVTIYTESEGSIPYIIILPSGDRLMEPFEYIREQITPHVQEQYGGDLIRYQEIEEYEIGGKVLPAGLYTYKVKDYTVDMLRLLDSTGDHTVAYTAKYLLGESDATLAALDIAIRNYAEG